MTDRQAYARCAVMWLATTALVGLLAERHFGPTTADLVAWIPFAMCLRCTWKWWRAGQR